MIPKSTTFSHASRRTAATLIELIAGLALLSLLLTAMLMARARLVHQRTVTEARLRAISAADELLAGWYQHPNRFPRSAAGAIAGDSKLNWRTYVVPNSTAAAMGVEIVRLEIAANDSSAADGHPVTFVDVVLNADSIPTISPSGVHAR